VKYACAILGNIVGMIDQLLGQRRVLNRFTLGNGNKITPDETLIELSIYKYILKNPTNLNTKSCKVILP